MAELNRIAASKEPENAAREMKGYLKALDKLRHLVTIEDRQKRDYEEYKSLNGLNKVTQ